MADWTASMQQTFEFYEVDPATWANKRLIDTVTSCSITRDSSTATLETASFNCEEQLGECYIRVYLVILQNRTEEKFPLGTFLVQTTSTSFDGKAFTITADAYSPLLELKDCKPPIGYSIIKGSKVLDLVSDLAAENMRAPVVATSGTDELNSTYTAEFDENWLTFLSDLLLTIKYNFSLDALGRVMFAPTQTLSALSPVWVFGDDNSSILQADISTDRDLYGIPNVVEVYYSTNITSIYARVENDDENSIVSTVNRGREVVYRVENPSFTGIPTQAVIDTYAKDLLESLSTLTYKVKYKHGYCPVRVGDCVRLDYKLAGVTGINARVTGQTLSCTTGLTVTETAQYTKKLWEG